jgi:hypothetical protein
MVLIGLAMMQKGYAKAQANAMVEKPVGWLIFLAGVGFLVASIGAVLFIYERNKINSYNPTEILSKALKNNQTPSKATPAYPQVRTSGSSKNIKQD